MSADLFTMRVVPPLTILTQTMRTPISDFQERRYFIFTYVDHLFVKIKPKKFFVAVNGVPPRAKMN